MRHWSRYGVNGALEMTFMNYELRTTKFVSFTRFFHTFFPNETVYYHKLLIIVKRTKQMSTSVDFIDGLRDS